MSSTSMCFALAAAESASDVRGALGVLLVMVLPLLVLALLLAFCIFSAFRYSQTKSRNWLTALIVSGVLFLIPFVLAGVTLIASIVSGVQHVRKQSSGPSTVDRMIRTPDDALQLQMAAHWRSMSNLHSEAEIQVGNAARGEYLIVLEEQKKDFDGKLSDYAALASQALRDDIVDAVSTEMQITHLLGRPAHQCEVSGSVDGVEVEYLFTATEDSEHYFQILAWTLRSKKETAFPVFREVLETCALR